MLSPVRAVAVIEDFGHYRDPADMLVPFCSESDEFLFEHFVDFQ